MPIAYGKLKYVNKPVSKIVFGTASPVIMEMCPAGVPPMSADPQKIERGMTLLDQVFESGINTFDCSAGYGEESLGMWMQARKNRDSVVVLTKCGHPNQWRKRVTEYDILADLHDSLAKLKTDYIDIYLLHRDDPDVPVSVTVELMNRLHNEGIIGAFGVSNWTHERIAEANEYALSHGLIPFTVSSPNFGLADQVEDPWGGGCVTISGHGNAEARKWYADNGMPVFAYSSLGRGFFSGMVHSDRPEEAKQVLDVPAQKGYCYAENFTRLARAEELAKEKGVTVAQIAMAWIMNQELDVYALNSPINQAQLTDTLTGYTLKLTKEECRWLDLQIPERSK